MIQHCITAGSPTATSTATASVVATAAGNVQGPVMGLAAVCALGVALL